MSAAARYKPETAQRFLALPAQDGAALKPVAEKGLPTPRLERWKYTNLGAALPADLGLIPSHLEVRGGGGAGIVSRKPLPENVNFLPVRADVPYDRMLADLGRAFRNETVLIELAENEAPQEPVELVWTGAAGGLSAPALEIRLGANATLTVIEDHRGAGAYWKNQILRIDLAPGARLRHIRLLRDDPAAVLTLTADIVLEKEAVYEGFSALTGAALTRQDFRAVLRGAGARCDISGINLLRGAQHGDTTVLIEHEAPACRSNQFFRSVLDGRAHGVFQGKIHVHRAGQQTDGYQLSNALLLSEGAEMDTKPELEIYADDVKCSHGATTGQLDAGALFYLRSRGIPETQARGLLIGAFVGEAVEKIADETAREKVAALAQDWLRGVS
jgi:Fe-S cluster assembly protein SufD